ncbi:unnamed protein product [Musa acuminata subsp. burmannicoides]
MTLRFPFPVFSPLPPVLASSLRRLSIPSRSSSSSSPTPLFSSDHRPPLFLRPPAFAASRTDLHDFRRWAESLALAAGPRLSASDGGPDAALLRRELAWLVEDATVAAASESGVGEELRLRVELEELYRLWKARIEERRPFQYIVGCEHWRDLVLVVKEGVLIPRPETEMVVDLVAEVEGFEKGLWADLGTGSGAIAVGIGRMLQEGGRVFATDLSPVALEVARLNVERYELKDKIELRWGSWFEPLRDVEGKLMGLVSNPPYIPSSHIPGLQAEVGQHEPKLALDGGEAGMDHLLHLCEGSASALKSGGFFAFEISTWFHDQNHFVSCGFNEHKVGELLPQHKDDIGLCRNPTICDWIPQMSMITKMIRLKSLTHLIKDKIIKKSKDEYYQLIHNCFHFVLHRADALRTSKREMAVATRGVEREIASLQLEEKKLVAEIKKTAQTGNEAATRILARQLVRLRQQITNLQGTRAQIRGIATHTQAMYANTSISTGMKGASKAMAAMNKQMEPAKQLKVMKEFQKQSSQMDMTIEMMSEAIDETLDKDEAEEETEELTNQVLDEIGVDVASQLSSAPKGRIAVNNKKVDTASRNVAPESSQVDDLEKRLASLRRI